MKTITLRLCPKKIPGVDVIPAEIKSDTGVQIDTENKQIIIRLRSYDCDDSGNGEIRVRLTTQLPYYCDGEDWIWWERELIPINEDESKLADFPTLYVMSPTFKCHWTQTIVKLYGPPQCGDNGLIHFQIEYGIGKEKNPIEKHEQKQIQVCPGMKATVEHLFTDGDKTYQHEADSAYWCTCCMTGGTVKETIGDYGQESLLYLVEIQDTLIHCKSSDFAEYEIGDWVFVAIPGGECENPDRQTACKGGCAIVPVENEGGTLLALINGVRGGLGIPQLTMDDNLTTGALKHAQDLQEHQITGHIGSDGSTVEERLTSYWKDAEKYYVGENVAYGIGQSISNVFKAWMTSKVHYANITNPEFRNMGYAFADGTAIGTKEEDKIIGRWYVNTFGFKNTDVDEQTFQFPYRIIPIRMGDAADPFGA